MSQRRFGPTLGAGTVIEETDGQKNIDPAPLGVTVYATPLDRGPTNKLIRTSSLRSLMSKTGNLISGFDGPDCARDFWTESQGAGELNLLRIAAATIRAATFDVYSREMSDTVQSLTGGRSRPIMRITAGNGGRWAGRRRVIWRRMANTGAVAANALTTALTMLLDEWAGGYIQLDGVPTKQYAITGNSTVGVVAVSADDNMSADLSGGSDPTNLGYTLVLTNFIDNNNTERCMQVVYDDGEQNPSSEFSMAYYIDGQKMNRWPDLSMDPTSPRYFVRIINDDQSNDDIVVSDLLSPSNPTPSDRRPANEQSLISAVTSTTLTSVCIQPRNLSVSPQPNPAYTLGTTTTKHIYKDVLRFEIAVSAGNATITMKSKRLAGGAVVHDALTHVNTTAQAFAFTAPYSPLLPPITITVGSVVFKDGDVIEVDYTPFEPNSLVGGTLCADLVNKPRARFNIVSNTQNTITVQSGDLITDGGGTAGDRFMVFYRQRMGGSDNTDATPTNGYDGLSGLSDTDYTAVALNSQLTPARELLSENKGLIKLATPDRTSTSIQKAGFALAEAFNWQYRPEIPVDVVDEAGAISYINDTLGRSDMGKVSFPSYVDVSDPEKPGQLKRTPATGMIHGKEALVAKNYGGYHKPAAGTDVILGRVVRLPFTTVLNEEMTNPQGINLIKKNKGNYVLWGDRSISVDPSWKFVHKREMMSHYENWLRTSFDWITFALNDPDNYALLKSSITGMFLPEYQPKRALKGKTFDDACSIKIDSENNTDATQADGDAYADISLKLADTIERFIIRIGNAGIFESTSSSS